MRASFSGRSWSKARAVVARPIEAIETLLK